MKRGKKYVEAAKAVDRTKLYDTAEAISLVKQSAVANSMKPLKHTFVQDVTDVTLTSRFVEQLYCLMELENRCVFWYLQKMQRQKKHWQQALSS